MAAIPIRCLAFLLLTSLSIACVVYYLTFSWIYYTFDIKFMILCASILYTLYMFFYELKSERRWDMNDGMINNTQKVFMIDTYCKYLFPFLFAIFFYEIILALQTNFAIFTGKTVIFFLVQFYICIVLPVCSAIDLYTTPRTRNPAPTKDLLILLMMCAVLCGYKLLVSFLYDWTISKICPTIAEYVILALVTLNGYIIYDFANHKTTGGDYYVLFKSSDRVDVDDIKKIPTTTYNKIDNI
jgi:hypothetical protein